MGLIDDREHALATDHPARKRLREDILIKFRKLSWPDQFRIYKVIQGYFIQDTPGSEAWREASQRAECVEAVQKVAKHLGLPEGEVPGVEAYEQARKELGLEPSSSTIIRRWYSWREIAKAARGERVTMTPRQHAHFNAAIRQKIKGEEWLTGVREWLSERDPQHEPNMSEPAYDAWVEGRNEKKSKLPPLASGCSVREGLALRWNAVVEVAKGELNLADAYTRELERLRTEDGEFVALHTIALIFGISLKHAKHMTRGENFPAYAFLLCKRPVWYLSDIEAHHAGEPVPSRTAGWLQCEILTSKDIRKLCGGLTESGLKNALEPSNGGARAPRPAGHIGGVNYWFRITVEAWLSVHQTPTP